MGAFCSGCTANVHTCAHTLWNSGGGCGHRCGCGYGQGRDVGTGLSIGVTGDTSVSEAVGERPWAWYPSLNPPGGSFIPVQFHLVMCLFYLPLLIGNKGRMVGFLTCWSTQKCVRRGLPQELVDGKARSISVKRPLVKNWGTAKSGLFLRSLPGGCRGDPLAFSTAPHLQLWQHLWLVFWEP